MRGRVPLGPGCVDVPGPVHGDDSERVERVGPRGGRDERVHVGRGGRPRRAAVDPRHDDLVVRRAPLGVVGDVDVAVPLVDREVPGPLIALGRVLLAAGPVHVDRGAGHGVGALGREDLVEHDVLECGVPVVEDEVRRAARRRVVAVGVDPLAVLDRVDVADRVGLEGLSVVARGGERDVRERQPGAVHLARVAGGHVAVAAADHGGAARPTRATGDVPGRTAVVGVPEEVPAAVRRQRPGVDADAGGRRDPDALLAGPVDADRRFAGLGVGAPRHVDDGTERRRPGRAGGGRRAGPGRRAGDRRREQADGGGRGEQEQAEAVADDPGHGALLTVGAVRGSYTQRKGPRKRERRRPRQPPFLAVRRAQRTIAILVARIVPPANHVPVTRRCAPRCSVRPLRTIFVLFSTRTGCELTFHIPTWVAVRTIFWAFPARTTVPSLSSPWSSPLSSWPSSSASISVAVMEPSDSATPSTWTSSPTANAALSSQFSSSPSFSPWSSPSSPWSSPSSPWSSPSSPWSSPSLSLQSPSELPPSSVASVTCTVRPLTVQSPVG